jgi:hypothetical protein
MSFPLPERIIINDDILSRHYRRIEECRTIVSDAAKVAITPTFEPSNGWRTGGHEKRRLHCFPGPP